MVAYRLEWGETGVMSFIVNHNGKVFEKDLGKNSTALGAKMNAFDRGLGGSQWHPEGVRACCAALPCIFVMPVLQGCLLTRVLETLAQLCDELAFRVSVIREPGSGLRVVFEKPTLTQRDVIEIVGFEPSQTGGAEAVREFDGARPTARPYDPASSLGLEATTVRLKVEQIQLVSDVGQVDLGRIGLQGA